MTRFGIILATALILGCSGIWSGGQKAKPPAVVSEKQQPEQSADTDLIDFLDNGPKYKGKLVTFPVVMGDGDLRQASEKGGIAEFITHNKTTNYQILLTIPKGLAVPNAGPGEPLRLTFKCENESLISSLNVATKIERR